MSDYNAEFDDICKQVKDIGETFGNIEYLSAEMHSLLIRMEEFRNVPSAKLVEELNHLRKTYKEDKEYMIAMQGLLISEGGYVIDTGNYQNVNDEILRRLKCNIQRHPYLWKKFFMVA